MGRILQIHPLRREAGKVANGLPVEMIMQRLRHICLRCLVYAGVLNLANATSAAVPPHARIPEKFTGVWAEQHDHCQKGSGQPTFTLTSGGFRNLPGEKAYPLVRKMDRAGRYIQVSFYNSNGPLFWRSVEHFRLSPDGNALEYRFADRVVHWVRCSGPQAETQGLPGSGAAE